MKRGISIILAVVLGACASKPVPTTPTDAEKAQPSSGMSQPPKTSPMPMTPMQQKPLPVHQDPRSLLSKNRSVYFDFDEYTIKEEFRPSVQAHSKYLGENRNLKIKVEGNADERGSREYNLALGQRRAEPRMLGHDEAAWAENRRADIRYGDDK